MIFLKKFFIFGKPIFFAFTFYNHLVIVAYEMLASKVEGVGFIFSGDSMYLT